MSRIVPTKINCPKCGRISSYECYTSVNVSVDPHLREAILGGSFYCRCCPKCRHHFDVEQDLLYHDMRGRFCVWTKIPDESGIPKLEPGTEKAASKFQGYQTRIVSGRNDLVEKIKLADDGHDDVTIETIKLFLSIKDRIDLNAMFFYDRTETADSSEDTIEFVLFLKGSNKQQYRLNLEQACQRVEPYIGQIRSALETKWGPWTWVTRTTIIEALQDCGLGHKIEGKAIRVQHLSTTGNKVETWVVGRDVDQATVDEWLDVDSQEIYIMSFYKNGHPGLPPKN